MGRRKKRKKRYQNVEYYSMTPETKKGIIIVFLFIVAIISILSFLAMAGTAGVYIDWGLGIIFGWGRFIVPIVLIILGYALARPNTYDVSIPNYIGIGLFLLSLLAILHIKLPYSSSFELTFSGLGGGIIGYLVSYPMILYLGLWASLIVLLGILFVSFLLMFNTSIESIFEKSNLLRFSSLPFGKNRGDGDDEEEEDDDEYEDEEDEEEDEYEEDESLLANEVKLSPKTILAKGDAAPGGIRPQKIKIDLPINLLDGKKSKPTSGDIKVGMERIDKTLDNFNIPVEMGEVQVGPTVTQYTLKPSEGIKLSKITSLNNDLALALAAHPIRIEAPIPGKSLVGIEVPNQKPAVVRVREIIESMPFKKRKTNLSVVLGKDVSGKCWVDDLSTMPHMLVAGSTGSGKSVCLNAIILSLMYQNNPETLRFILVDPKRVEFPVYNGIPHLLTPVITDVTKTVYSLRWAISEMDRRFDMLAKVKKRNIASYNAVAKEKLPYIVIVIDELADLMISAAAEIEACIIRLTQMARAIGIHMIVATQRPSVDVITGLIKANIPCRIAFSVASLMDSRTILDSAGAEKLVGKGDMLFMTPRTATPRRLQGAFVADNEIKRVVDFLKKAVDGEPDYHDAVTEKPSSGSSFDFKGGNSGGGGGDDGDALFDEAKNLVIEAGKASASYLQRRLRVGYARAARLIDLLEESGVVGPADGAKPREILVDRVEALSQVATEIIEEDVVIEDPVEEELINEDDFEDDESEDETDDVFEDEEDAEEDGDEFEDEDDVEYIEDDEEDGEETPKKKNTSDDEIY